MAEVTAGRSYTEKGISALVYFFIIPLQNGIELDY